MGKLDRAVGFVCLALAAFATIAAFSMMAQERSEPAYATGLATAPSIVAFVLALVAAIPGFFLVFRKGAI